MLEPLGELDAAVRLGDLQALLQMTLAFQVDERPGTLADVLELLAEVSTPAVAPEKVSVPALGEKYPPGSLIDGYRVIEYLDSGGCFDAYRVTHQDDDTVEYVAKVARHRELIETAVQAVNALGRLRHERLARICAFQFAPTARYHLLEEYVPGMTAADWLEAGQPLPAAQVATLGQQLGSALHYMETEQPPVYHGDITPRNIILNRAGDEARLIDFSLAWVDNKGGGLGTLPYRPPERDLPGTTWPPSGDVYGLGMVLCELLFGELPYETTNGYRRTQLHDDLFARNDLASPELRRVLRRCIEPDPTARWGSAGEFVEALGQTPELGGKPRREQTDRGQVPYLGEVIQAYNHAARNAENRGLDSDFAQRTYVATTLDDCLLEDILSHRFALVVLTGNPGDGKTAFLQRLAQELGGPEQPLNYHHWAIAQDGWTFECVLDGSASDSGRELQSSNEVLSQLFAPLEQAAAADPSPGLAARLQRTQLVGMNEGRLLEYLDKRVDTTGQWAPGWVGEQIYRCLGERDGEPSADFVLVDLNQRSLAFGEGDEFGKVLDALVWGSAEGEAAGDPWTPCLTCRIAPSCPVRYNVDTLRDPVLGPAVRERLRSLLVTVHSRGRLHITMRELRSTLAYLIFGEHTCDELHQAMAEHGRLPADRRYYHRLFTAGEAAGRLFAELSDFDPAKVDTPLLDRLLYRTTRGRLGGEALPGERLEPPVDGAGSASQTGEAGEEGGERQTSGAAADRREFFNDQKRQAFFEARPEAFRHALETAPADEAGDDAPETAATAPWMAITPFRWIGEWLDCLPRPGDDRKAIPDGLAQRLCEAISRTDDVPESLINDHLVIRAASAPKTDLVVLRRYPLTDFSLCWNQTAGLARAPGAVPTAMRLEYRHGEPSLDISADLFELLLRAAAGYRLGSDELQAMASQLQLFKNRLLAIPARSVILDHPVYGRHQAEQLPVNGVMQIRLTEVSQ